MYTGTKQTHYLSPKTGHQIADASHYAAVTGTGLDLAVTLNLDLAHIPHNRPQPFITAYLHLIADFLRTKLHIKPYHIWVLENPDQHLNLHLQLHWPQDLDHDLYRLKHWLQLCGGLTGPKTLQHDRLYSFADQSYWTRYLLKGCPLPFCEKYHILHSPQGIITGKRGGTSETLTPTKLNQNPPPPTPYNYHLVLQTYN